MTNLTDDERRAEAFRGDLGLLAAAPRGDDIGDNGDWSGWFWMNTFIAARPGRGYTGVLGSSCPEATRDPHGDTNGPTAFGRPWHRAFQVGPAPV